MHSLDRVLARLSRRFSVVRMTPDRTQELRDFLRRAYVDQPGSAFQDPDRTLAHWRWSAELCPPSGGEQPAGWVCLRNGRIVGYFGVSPAVAQAGGRSFSVCWGRDLIGAPETRSAGVGPLLIQAAVRESRKPFFIAGLNPVSFSLFRRMGFLDMGRIPLTIKVHQAGRFVGTFPWPGWLKPAAALALRAGGAVRKLSARPEAPGLSFEALERFDERFDRWWGEIEGRFPCVIRRSSAAMNWRYLQHPTHRYTLLVALKDSRWKGLAVVRHSRSRGLAAGFITELLADPRDGSVIAALLDYTEGFLLRSAPEPLVLSRCAVLHPAFERALLRAGFFRVPSTLHWMMASGEGPEALQPFSRRGDWMLNGGDSDLDAV